MLRASVPHAVTSSMLSSCVPAKSTDEACSQDVSCSQQTQAAIATSAMGTQCALTLLINGSSQTEQELSVLEVNYTQVGDSGGLDRFATSRDDADISAEPSRHTCSCDRHIGNAGQLHQPPANPVGG
ncbi:uncharacterized protein LOC144158240 isoform X5 [Haemaphysalis longicornis]